MKFKVLVGIHIQNGPDGMDEVHVAGGPAFEGGKGSKGQDIDLCARFNKPGMTPKFEYAEGPGSSAYAKRPKLIVLDDMVDSDLAALAEAHEIDLGGAAERQDIIARLKVAFA